MPIAILKRYGGVGVGDLLISALVAVARNSTAPAPLEFVTSKYGQVEVRVRDEGLIGASCFLIAILPSGRIVEPEALHADFAERLRWEYPTSEQARSGIGRHVVYCWTRDSSRAVVDTFDVR